MGAVVADSCCPDVGLLVVVGGLGSADHLEKDGSNTTNMSGMGFSPSLT